MWLVTGGAGFVGSHLVRHLVDHGKSVRVIDNFSTGKIENLADLLPKIELIEADIRDGSMVDRVMQDVSVVLHQAAQASVPKSIDDPIGTYAVNVDGTLKLLQAAVKNGVARFVLASTSAVYGDDPSPVKAESLLPRPISPYASSKLAAEQLCAVHNLVYGLQSVSLRYFNVFGPGQSPNSTYAAVIPRLIDRICRGDKPVIYGDGEQTRDFVYIDDVVRANLLAASKPVKPGTVLNIASGISTSVNDVLAEICRNLNLQVDVDYQPERAGDIRISLADASLAADVIGFTARISIAEGLNKTISARLMS